MTDNSTNGLRILITGGAGFIGSHLAKELSGRGNFVTVVDNLRNGSIDNIHSLFNDKNFAFVETDVLNLEKMIELCRHQDIIYHLACLGVRHSLHSPLENHRVNAEGTLNMLEGARRNKVRKFFYISTSEIYGDVEKFPIDEFSLPHPKTVYGSSKLAGENYTNSYHKCFGLDITILRIFNNYGPYSHYEGDSGEIIPRSIVNIIYGKNPVVFGDGSVTRDFFYVKDTATVLADLINQQGLTGETINIGTGQEISMRRLLETVIRLMKKENIINIEYLEDRPADVPRLWVDNRKFLKITGFKPSVTIEEGLLKTIEYFVNLSKKNSNLLSKIETINWLNK
jgi:UDP-glucose 4-epimerase